MEGTSCGRPGKKLIYTKVKGRLIKKNSPLYTVLHYGIYFSDDAQPDTQTLITSMSAISIRPPGESSEERRFRKKALKELRRVRQRQVVIVN